MQQMNFGEALEALKAGKKVRRPDWTDEFLFINDGDEDYPFPTIDIYIDCVGSKLYTPHPDDLLAEDWYVSGEKPCKPS